MVPADPHPGMADDLLKLEAHKFLLSISVPQEEQVWELDLLWGQLAPHYWLGTASSKGRHPLDIHQGIPAVSPDPCLLASLHPCSALWTLLFSVTCFL